MGTAKDVGIKKYVKKKLQQNRDVEKESGKKHELTKFLASKEKKFTWL